MPETQHLLSKIRPPRVQITYDVEIGDAIEMKELPFVVGVIADLSGDRDPDAPLPAVKNRKFAEIDRDNFNEIMLKQNTRLAFQVPNMLANDGTELNLLMHFKSIEDFDPVNVIQQIPAMATLYETRSKLKDLLSKLDGNDTLDALLTDVLTNTTSQTQLKQALNLGAPAQAQADKTQATSTQDSDPKPGATPTTKK